MNQLALTFAIDQQYTLDTLEAVLAIARRGGLQLSALDLHSGEQDDRAAIELTAPDPDRLELFLARLRKLIGVSEIVSVSQKLTRMHVA